MTINDHVRGGVKIEFNGIKIDIVTNSRSGMSKSQYLAYQKEFGRNNLFDPEEEIFERNWRNREGHRRDHNPNSFQTFMNDHRSRLRGDKK